MENRIQKEGDIQLGGLFSVHTEVDHRSAAYCSGYDLPSILAAQAMIYQVEKINRNPKILPNLTLGYEMMDDCCSTDLAVKAATMFMMGETAQERRHWIVQYRKKRMQMAKGLAVFLKHTFYGFDISALF